MTRKNNKKGFTIVELVIVIAVIAILAAVLIPTFSGLVEKANKNAALTEAKNNMTNDLVNAEADYANMLTYEVSNVQYYETTDETVNTYYHAACCDKEETDSVHGDSEGQHTYNPANVNTVAEGGTKVAAYAGVYNGSTWVDEVNGYTCTFDVASGEWTVVKP